MERANELTGAAAQELFNQVHFHLTRIAKTHDGLVLDKSVISNVKHNCRFRIISLCGHVDANGGTALGIYLRHNNPQMLGCASRFWQKESIATL
jgi:hypothetical protein